MATKQPPEQMVNFKLARPVVAALKRRADAEDRTVSAVLRRLVADYLAQARISA